MAEQVEAIGKIEHEMLNGKRTGRWRPRVGSPLVNVQVRGRLVVAQAWRPGKAGSEPVEAKTP